jgi:hypothetical protein
VPDSADLAESVLGAGRLDAAGRTEAWHAAGRLLRDAFAAGIEHADLNLRNILVVRTAAGARALLLDLDRAAVRPRALERGTRDAMLRRLHRSRRKLEGALGRLTSDMELSAFEAGLNADD